MMNQFSNDISRILAISKDEAFRLSSSQIGPEHLLLGILKQKNSILTDLFSKLNIEPDSIINELEEKVLLSQTVNVDDNQMEELALNEMANNILKLSVLEARLQHNMFVDANHVVLAILHDRSNNGAKEILEQNKISYKEIVKYIQQKNQITNGLELSDDEEDIQRSPNSDKSDKRSANTAQINQTKTPILNNFSIDLTQAARDGKLDMVVGREKEIQRVIEILCRRKKNNPILIGEPGVGKSAIAEGLAQMIAKRHTSPLLYNKRIVSLNMTAIVAGTKYRGQFEERIQALLKEIEDNPDIIVFIDEIHTLIGAGSTPGSMDAANIMKPALARGVIQCIGATTLDEYRNSIEKDGALERRFQKVLIEPTSYDQTLSILKNIKDRYERHHSVNYTDEAIEACVKLTERYITDRSFPDKAIDALDEVGSKVQIKNAKMPPSIIEKEKQIKDVEEEKRQAVSGQNFEKAAELRDRQSQLEKELQTLNEEWTEEYGRHRETVTEKDVAEVVSVMSGIPVQRIERSEGSRLRNLDMELKQQIIGQDDAIDKIVRCIKRNRIGMRDPNKPIGVFMFLGPTGVGKTFLAKKLAEMMFGSQDSLIRIDMSEYSESFNTSRLIGAPPGYVGYESGGQLTEKVRRHPYSIVLLDEIEKAHSNVFNMLLQVLDDGRLTDGNGRNVDFRNTIIIMTSNSGTRQLREFGKSIGFNMSGEANDDSSQKEYARNIIKKHMSKQFTPEFLNRLDEIVTFDQLDRNSIRMIIDIELKTLFSRIKELGYSVDITDAAKDFVASKGYDSQFGARPLKRAIQNYIENQLCEKILSEEIKSNGIITIDKSPQKEELTFICQ